MQEEWKPVLERQLILGYLVVTKIDGDSKDIDYIPIPVYEHDQGLDEVPIDLESFGEGAVLCGWIKREQSVVGVLPAPFPTYRVCYMDPDFCTNPLGFEYPGTKQPD